MSGSQLEVNDQRPVGDLASSISQLRSQLQDQEAKHRGVLSSVRQVPGEVLSENFTFAVPYVLDQEERAHMLTSHSYAGTGAKPSL
jgi:hypothetical protein